jgi:mannose-6-phosphate isomerase-like protein (cupin superfamily)
LNVIHNEHEVPFMSLDPQHTYIHLAEEGTATELAGGEKFWSLPESEIERYGRGWLVSEFESTADWPNWEMHPEGDEIVYLLAGSVDILLEHPDGLRKVALRGSGAVVVPRGVWHTAKVAAPSRMLHITCGAGTQHRPV